MCKPFSCFVSGKVLRVVTDFPLAKRIDSSSTIPLVCANDVEKQFCLSLRDTVRMHAVIETSYYTNVYVPLPPALVGTNQTLSIHNEGRVLSGQDCLCPLWGQCINIPESRREAFDGTHPYTPHKTSLTTHPRLSHLLRSASRYPITSSPQHPPNGRCIDCQVDAENQTSHLPRLEGLQVQSCRATTLSTERSYESRHEVFSCYHALLSWCTMPCHWNIPKSSPRDRSEYNYTSLKFEG